MQITNFGFYLPLSVISTGAIIVWYLKFQYKVKKVDDDEYFDVLWTEPYNKCTNIEHDIDKCDNYCGSIRLKKINLLINEAKYSIDMAMHIFTLNDILLSFINAHERGVKIRIILCTGHQNASGAQTISLYEEGKEYQSHITKYSGIEVYTPMCSKIMMHHKFCIIDGENRVKNITNNNLIQRIFYKRATDLKEVLINGSCNWTNQGMFDNWENIIITNNKYLLNEFEKQFELMWKTFQLKSATYKNE